MIVCAAAELEPKYEKLYGYLQDDMTRRSPTMGLILDILCETPEERIEARKRFLPGSRLLDNKILEHADGREDGLQLSSPLRLNPDVLASILTTSDGRKPSPAGSAGFPISEAIRDKLRNLTIGLARGKGMMICHLQGPYGSGKREAAAQISAALGKDKVDIDLAALAYEDKGFEQAFSREMRKALLRGSVVHVENLDLPASDDPRAGAVRSTLTRSLESYPGPIILSSLGPVDLGKDLQRKILALKLPLPEYHERRRIWSMALGGRLPREDVDDLASKFRYTGGQIQDAARAAFNLAALEGRDGIRKEDVYKGCRIQADRKLSTLSRRVQVENRWEDLVLSEVKLEQLKEIVARVRHQGEVYHDWGFGKKLSLGKGINVLFSGLWNRKDLRRWNPGF